MNILHKINKILKWEPHNLFHETRYHYREYDSPRVEGNLFDISTVDGSWDECFIYTTFGKHIQKWPIILEVLFKLIYYIIAWPLYLCVKSSWEIFKGIFIPQNWLD